MRNNENIGILWDYKWDKFWWKIDNLNFLYEKWFNIPKWFWINKLIDKNELNKLYKKYVNSEIYIARSSANCEDWKKLSYAWLFESIEWFYCRWNLYKDIENIFDSIKNKLLDIYEKQILWQSLKNRKMNVLIQEYIVGDYSGVYLSNINNERILGIIAWWNKLLIDWVVNWINLYLDRNFQIIKQEYNIQEKILDWDLEIKEYNKKVKIGKNLILELIKNFIKIEKIYWYWVDIEWIIKNNKIYILQVRPITV